MIQLLEISFKIFVRLLSAGFSKATRAPLSCDIRSGVQETVIHYELGYV